MKNTKLSKTTARLTISSAPISFIMLMVFLLGGYQGDSALLAQPFPPSGGILSPYLIGTFDLRDGRRTFLHIINPTANHLRIMVAFFDDNERPLPHSCVRDTLSANDLLEINVGNHIKEPIFGVVKVVSFRDKQDRDDIGDVKIGIVGYQRHFFTDRGFPFFTRRDIGATETILHPIPYEILVEDFNKIKSACP